MPRRRSRRGPGTTAGRNDRTRSAQLPQKFPIVAGNITHLSSNITCLYQPVAEPGSSTFIVRGGFGGVTDTKIWREARFTISIRYWPGGTRDGESTSTGSRRWDSAL